jgi:hypothetical protein
MPHSFPEKLTRLTISEEIDPRTEVRSDWLPRRFRNRVQARFSNLPPEAPEVYRQKQLPLCGQASPLIPVGNSFDAYAAVAKVMSSAKRDVFVVDPYMDDTVLIDFGGTLVDNVALRLLTDQATAKPNLAPAAARWKAQYAGRPLEVRLASPKALHDRAIFIDGSEAWTVTQSLKDLAKRSPAEIIRADDIAPLKIAAYEDVWSRATVIA